MATPTTEPGAGERGGVTVVLGDAYSADASVDGWIAKLDQLAPLGEVTNLSTSGRGYYAKPSRCEGDTCGNFIESLDAIEEAEPELVIVFGGAADGNNDMRPFTSEFFTALRDAVPDAKIVALNPVSTGDEAPYWMTMHARSIKAAVEAVDGTFINVGQPSIGSGDSLSDEAAESIAEDIAKELT